MSFLGVGVGLRPKHYAEILADPRSVRLGVDWFEAISENFMVRGGRPLRVLAEVRAHFPVALHGVSLNIGSADPLDERYLDQLDELVRRIEPALISDHLSWTGVDGRNLHDLLPLPLTRATLGHVADRVCRVQERLGRRIALENPSTYAAFCADEMPEWDFLAGVAERADCGILLDVNNVFVSSHNHGLEADTYVDSLPSARIVQIHLAGASESGPLLIDTHDHPVCDEVWRLYERVVRRVGPVSTLIEWDDRIPPFAELAAEAARARGVLERIAQEEEGLVKTRGQTLVSAQRELARRVSGLEGVEVALAGEAAGSLLRSDCGISAAERVSIYANAYFARIHGALRDDFGTLHAALGHDAFRDLAKLFLMAHPPTSFSMRFVGLDLPRFLAGPVGEPFLRRWPFAADLASLEWTIADLFDAQDAPVLAREALAAIPAAEWAGLRFELIPAHRTLSLAWPVERIREAWERGFPLPELEEADTTLLVHRRREEVLYRRVPPLEAAAVAQLGARGDFASVCAEVATGVREDEAPARTAELLERWLADELISRVNR